jgi:predicted XRE-type DNA-binding protein
MTRKAETIEHTPSSGNVFADLGFEEPEIERVKAHLAFTISQLIKERGLTQAGAAQLLGLKQPNVSLLVRGNTDSYSLERLIALMHRFGQDVFIGYQPTPSSRSIGRTIVGPMRGGGMVVSERAGKWVAKRKRKASSSKPLKARA